MCLSLSCNKLIIKNVLTVVLFNVVFPLLEVMRVGTCHSLSCSITTHKITFFSLICTSTWLAQEENDFGLAWECFLLNFSRNTHWVCTTWSNTTYKTWFYSRFQGWNRYLWCKMTCAYYYHLTISNLLTVVLINGAFPLLEIMCWGLGRLTASPPQ